MGVFKATMVLITYGTMRNNFGTVEKYPEMIIVNCIYEGDHWLGELIRSQGVVIHSCWDLLTAGGSRFLSSTLLSLLHLSGFEETRFLNLEKRSVPKLNGNINLWSLYRKSFMILFNLCISCGHLKILHAAVTWTLCFSMVCKSRAKQMLGRILGFKTLMPKNFGLKIGCHKIWMEMCVS